MRLVTTFAAYNSWPIFQLDVAWAFKFGNLNEHAFVQEPLVMLRLEVKIKINQLKRRFMD